MIPILCALATPPFPTPPSPLRSLQAQLEGIATGFRGVLGLSFHHLKRGDRIELRGDELFPTASTIKIAVMAAALEKCQQGKLGYYEQREYTEADKRGGAGFIQFYKPGTKLELKELLHLMITVSDNSATAMLVRWIGAMEVNAWLDRQNLRRTRLLTQIPEAETGLRRLAEDWGLGVTTPNEMLGLMERLLDGRAGTPAACEEMRRILSHQYFDEGIPSQIPPGVCVASKSGAIDRSRSEAAIVHSPSGDYVLAVYTRDNADTRWARDNEAEEAIRAISRAVWRHYHPRHRWTPPPGAEKF